MTLPRRHFLAALGATAVAPALPSLATPSPTSPAPADLLRPPDLVSARLNAGQPLLSLTRTGRTWSAPGLHVTTDPTPTALPILVSAPGNNLTYLHLRWRHRSDPGTEILGDAWERSYGDLGWTHTVPERVLPWYFLTLSPDASPVVSGFGVQTGAAALCFWQHDPDGISLWLDLRNGGEPTELGTRELHACTVLTHRGRPGEPIHQVAEAFCRTLCPTPRLPPHPLFGSNDWNYAYGHNTADGILQGADLIASLAPSGPHRPTVVIDDGWQDPARFPSMPALAAGLRSRNVHPGLWIRPLRAASTDNPSLLLPQIRFGKSSARNDLAFDPTIPEALDRILSTVRDPVGWGYTFLKHDFSTYELFGRWGNEMGPEPTLPGWHLHDRTRTNAEVVLDLYRAIRQAAGPATILLGCNTVGHLAAGIFDSQRIGDDTSGRDWERTRRMGVNTLAHRIAQHRTFSFIDADIVAITAAVPWELTQQWMSVVAHTGTSLFLSPDPAATDAKARTAMRESMALVAASATAYPTNPTLSTTPDQWTLSTPTPSSNRTFDWLPPDGASPFPA